MKTATEILTDAASFARAPDCDFTGEHRAAEDAALSALRKVKEGLDEARSIVERYENQIPSYGVLLASILIDHVDDTLRPDEQADGVIARTIESKDGPVPVFLGSVDAVTKLSAALAAQGAEQ